MAGVAVRLRPFEPTQESPVIGIENMDKIKIQPAHLVYLLIFLTPFSIYSVAVGGGIDFDRVDLAPAVFLSLCLMPFFVVHYWKKKRFPRIGLLGLLHLFFFIIALIGILIAGNKWMAMKGAGVYALNLFPFFLFTATLLQTRREVEIAVKVFILTGLLNALMGWIELAGFWTTLKPIFPPFAEHFHSHFTLKPFGDPGDGSLKGMFGIHNLMRMFGFFEAGTDTFGSFTLIPLGLSAYGVVRYQKIYGWLVLFFSMTILFGLQRNAYLGVACLFSTIFLLFSKGSLINTPFLIRRSLLLAFFFILLTGAAYLWSRSASPYQGSNLQKPVQVLVRLNPFIQAENENSKEIFIDNGRLALKYGFSNAGFGLGGQNFDEYVWRHEKVPTWGSHSSFINFLGDHGYWGLLTQILIVFVTVYYGLKTYQTSLKRGEVDYLPLFLTAIFLGLVFVGVVRTFYTAIHTFAVAGLITKLYFLKRNVLTREEISWSFS